MGGFCSNDGCGVDTECPRCDPPIDWRRLNAHRLELAEQATAERDKAKADLAMATLVIEGLHGKLASRDEEVDELTAQVAALTGCMRRLRHYCECSACCEKDRLLSDIPRAAQAMLASQKVAQFYNPDAWHQNADLLDAHRAWLALSK